MIAHDTQKLEH